MATIDKIVEMIGAIKTIYPYYSKGISDNQLDVLIETWGNLLQAYPDDVVEIGFRKCLQICKMPPTPADVIEQIQAIYKTFEPSDEELWLTYSETLRKTCREMQRFCETFIDETGISLGDQARMRVDRMWNDLPDKVKSYVGSKGELMRLAREWNYTTDNSWEKQRFMKAMPIMEKRREYSDLLLDGGDNRLLLK